MNYKTKMFRIRAVDPGDFDYCENGPKCAIQVAGWLGTFLRWAFDLNPKPIEPPSEEFMQMLVEQEICMWYSLGQDVPPSELDWICKRRGFTEAHRKQLTDALITAGLYSGKEKETEVYNPDIHGPRKANDNSEFRLLCKEVGDSLGGDMCE